MSREIVVAVATEEEIGSPIANRFVRCYILSDVYCISCLVSNIATAVYMKEENGTA